MQIKGSTFTYDTLPKDVQKKQNCYTFKKFVNVTCNQPIQGLQNWEARPSAMGERYYKYADRIRRFRVRDDDVWIISYPKCGTTWTQEMVWLLGNELDYATGAKVDLSDRSPFLEYVYYSFMCVCVWCQLTVSIDQTVVVRITITKSSNHKSIVFACVI